MAYSIQEARQLVIKAGLKLVQSGLVARTWGNISARVSDTQFVVTPKGRAYDSLKPDDIVLVNIADCSYEGDIKPSSEKGVHAASYRLRPKVNFVIHTHQENASVFSVLGEDLILKNGDRSLLGLRVASAPYGISSTKKLTKNVAKTIADNPYSKAFLMKGHGAICLGASMEEAFDLAFALEHAAEVEIRRLVNVTSNDEVRELFIKKFTDDQRVDAKDFGSSVRHDRVMTLTVDGKSENYAVDNRKADTSDIVNLHRSIYLSSDVNCIIYNTHPDVVAVSASGKTLRPYLDDLAQISGVNIRCAEVKDIVKKLHNRNAVLLRGYGALCTGKDQEDAEAVSMILEKGCAAEILATLVKKRKPLGRFDAWIQRLVYTHKYAKLKK